MDTRPKICGTALKRLLGYVAAALFLAGRLAVSQFKLATSTYWSAPSSGIIPLFIMPSNETSSVPLSGWSASNSAGNASQPFEWNFLDFTKMGACGVRKCFFRSSSAGSDSDISGMQQGYLVAKRLREDTYEDDFFDAMMRTWNVANRLEKEQNMSHFLLQPPQKVKPPPLDILKRVNSLAIRDGHVAEAYYGNGTLQSLVVQKVRVAPSPALIPRCFFGPRGRSGRLFFDSHSTRRKEFYATITDKGEFMTTFQKEMKHLLALLTEEKRLWYDFQFLVDSKAHIYHIDLDRIEQGGYSFPKQNAFEKCFGSIIEYFSKKLEITPSKDIYEHLGLPLPE